MTDQVCIYCDLPLWASAKENSRIEEHHISYDPPKKVLLHAWCHTRLHKLSPKDHKQKVGLSECVKENKDTVIDKVREVVDYSNASPEMKSNEIFLVSYRNWLRACLRKYGNLLKRDCIYKGAEAIGSNPTTTRRYLEMMIVSNDNGKEDLGGELIEYKDSWKQKRIKFDVEEKVSKEC